MFIEVINQSILFTWRKNTSVITTKKILIQKLIEQNPKKISQNSLGIFTIPNIGKH